MPKRERLLAVAGLIGLALPALSALASDPVASPVEQIAEAVLSDLGEDRVSPDLFVAGERPELPGPPCAPRGARVLGGVLTSAGTSYVLRPEKDATSTRDACRSELEARGWRLGTDRQFGRGGFVSRGHAWTFCGPSGSEVVTLRPVGRGSGRDYLVVFVHERSRWICSDARRRDWEDPVDVPSLEPPDGARSRSGGAGSSSDSWYQDAVLSTELSAVATANHYGQQLRVAGWSPVERADGRAVALEVFERADADGVRWRLALFVSPASSSGSHQLRLHAVKTEQTTP